MIAGKCVSPCPNCGGTRLELKVKWINWCSFVRCLRCGFEGPHVGRNGTDDSGAWRAWNNQ
jgi:hypothetical protein